MKELGLIASKALSKTLFFSQFYWAPSSAIDEIEEVRKGMKRMCPLDDVDFLLFKPCISGDVCQNISAYNLISFRFHLKWENHFYS